MNASKIMANDSVKNLRIVFDAKKRVLHIAGIEKGDKDGTLNEAAYMLLKQIKTTHNLEEYYFLHKEFLDDCYLNGWIDENLQLRGDIKEVTGEYHLKSVQFELLLKCNLSCGYCYCGAGQGRTETLSKADVLNALDDCERLGVLRIDFTGGEFFLYPNWREILNYARNLNLTVSIHTNGMALTEKNVKYIKKMGVCLVQVSSDGHNSDLHNSIRGHPQGFQKMEAGLRRLAENDIKFRVNIMVHKKTKDHIQDIVNYYNDKGYNVNFDWVSPFGSELSSNLGVTVSEYYDAVVPLRHPDEINSEPTPCGRDLNWQADDYEPVCGVGYSYLFITASGEMAICPTLTSRENSALFNSPNLKDISLFDAWTGHPYYDNHRYVNCKNVEICSEGTSCRGGCRANAFAQSSGKLDAPNMIECNMRKNKTNKYVDFQERYDDGDFNFVE